MIILFILIIFNIIIKSIKSYSTLVNISTKILEIFSVFIVKVNESLIFHFSF
jgi:hypothetical protein